MESAKHSHFWAADRLELADRVERLRRKRDIKDEEGREEVREEKLLVVGKNNNEKNKVFVFPYRKTPGDKVEPFFFSSDRNFGPSSMQCRISSTLFFFFFF